MVGPGECGMGDRGRGLANERDPRTARRSVARGIQPTGQSPPPTTTERPPPKKSSPSWQFDRATPKTSAGNLLIRLSPEERPRYVKATSLFGANRSRRGEDARVFQETHEHTAQTKTRRPGRRKHTTPRPTRTNPP